MAARGRGAYDPDNPGTTRPGGVRGWIDDVGSAWTDIGSATRSCSPGWARRWLATLPAIALVWAAMLLVEPRLRMVVALGAIVVFSGTGFARGTLFAYREWVDPASNGWSAALGALGRSLTSSPSRVVVTTIGIVGTAASLLLFALFTAGSSPGTYALGTVLASLVGLTIAWAGWMTAVQVWIWRDWTGGVVQTKPRYWAPLSQS